MKKIIRTLVTFGFGGVGYHAGSASFCTGEYKY